MIRYSVKRRGLILGAAVGLSMVVLAPMIAESQCKPAQVQRGRKLLRSLNCIQADLPPGAQGPPGPPGSAGPQGPPGFAGLAYVDAAISLAPGTFDCAGATCAPADRIINCDSATFNPSTNSIDPNTLLFSAIGFRDPEDDTPANLLAADTCVACFSNFNSLATVRILARAVCVVGAKPNFLARSHDPAASSRLSAEDVRVLLGRLSGE